MKYKEELNRAMEWLGEKPDTLFLGQAVGYDGTAMTNTIKKVDGNKKALSYREGINQFFGCTGIGASIQTADVVRNDDISRITHTAKYFAVYLRSNLIFFHIIGKVCEFKFLLSP